MVESEELLKTLEEIESEALKLIREANSVEEIEAVRLRYLAKRSQLQQVLRSIGKLPVEMRPKVGELANRVREAIQSAFEEKRKELEAVERDRRLASEKIDVTMPGRIWRIGSLHPITQTINEICSIFTDLGFEVVDGPEIETEWHNFVALNMPQDHPARDDHDSFYITDGILLRTETSAVQIRVMESRQPPIRIVSPGRVYRRDEVDRTHSHTFHQVEGLLVDEDVTFADLKGTLIVFAKRFFGEDVKVRFRPHYFPFT
jgi:phenylalanyl-tRNA synthetase alpha chain